MFITALPVSGNYEAIPLITLFHCNPIIVYTMRTHADS